MKFNAVIIFCLALFVGTAFAAQCGSQASGAVCPHGLCCSHYGWCGNTDLYCGKGCQSNCPSPSPINSPPSPGGDDVGRIITEEIFEEILKHRNDLRCKSNGFYTYSAFLTAARSFYGFGTTGDDAIRKRELAAFFGQTSHETRGGWAKAPDGPYAWGYCYIRQLNRQETFCIPDPQWPCVPGQKYYGRGPIQLTYNTNYGPAGRALGVNLLTTPDRVATDPDLSFKAAIWYWMTTRGNIPSSHDVIIGNWQPSPEDLAAKRVPGYGVITNIINGALECGYGPNDDVASRIEFYKRNCDILDISYGDNLNCYDQKPFGQIYISAY